jgi:hypothetical protein
VAQPGSPLNRNDIFSSPISPAQGGSPAPVMTPAPAPAPAPPLQTVSHSPLQT